MSIVLSHSDVFNQLTANDTVKILRTSKATETSELIIKRDAYTARHYYYQLYDTVYDLVMAKNVKNKDEIRACNKKISSIMDDVYTLNDTAYDCFKTIFIAEYKEMLFAEVCNPDFSYIDVKVLKKYEELVEFNEDFYTFFKQHVHSPEHPVYLGENKYYNFHDKAESKGIFMSDMYETGNFREVAKMCFDCDGGYY